MADTTKNLKIRLEGAKQIADAMKQLNATMNRVKPTLAALNTNIKGLNKTIGSMTTALKAHASALKQFSSANNTAAASQTKLNQAIAKTPAAKKGAAFGPPNPTAAQWTRMQKVNAPPGPIKLSQVMQGTKGQQWANAQQIANAPFQGQSSSLKQWKLANKYADAQTAAAAAANKTQMYSSGQKPKPTALANLLASWGKVQAGGSAALNGGPLSTRLNGAASAFSAARSIMSNPIVTASLAVLGTAATAVVALAHASKAAADDISQFGSLKMVTGGSTAQTAQLKEMFAQMGITGDHANVMAGRMTERLMTDPMAMQWADRMNVRFNHGPYGDPNSGEKIIRILDNISKLQGAQRTQAAFAIAGGRNGDYVAIMQYIQANTPRIQAGRQMSAFADSQIYSEPATKQASEFNASWERLAGSMSRLGSSALQPLINGAIGPMQQVAHIMDAQAIVTHKAGVVAQMLNPLTYINSMMGGPNVGDLLKDLLGQGDAHKEAIEENTGELRRANRTIYGGGARAAAAMPPSQSGIQFSRDRASGGFRYGTL